MIPKKIHYCWFGKNPLPNDVKNCIKSWKKYCPEYEIIEWNETNFDVNCNEFIKKAYESKKWAFVSDYARLKIIYENGGIYLDTDVELLKNLDELLNNECFLPIQQLDKNIATGLGFGAIKKHKIIKEMLDAYDDIEFNIEDLDSIACPIINSKVLNKYGYKFSNEIEYLKNINVKIYPPKYFDPVSPGNNHNLIDKDTFSIHHYSATWTPKKQRIKRKIIRLIGQKNINNFKNFFKRG